MYVCSTVSKANEGNAYIQPNCSLTSEYDNSKPAFWHMKVGKGNTIYLHVVFIITHVCLTPTKAFFYFVSFSICGSNGKWDSHEREDCPGIAP